MSSVSAHVSLLALCLNSQPTQSVEILLCFDIRLIEADWLAESEVVTVEWLAGRTDASPRSNFIMTP